MWLSLPGNLARTLAFSGFGRAMSQLKPATAVTPAFVVCKEGADAGEEGEGLGTSKAFLTRFPRGAYTTARTVGLRSVFEFEAHVERIAQTARLMLGEESPRYPSVTDAARLRSRMMRCMGACIALFGERHPGGADELKLTLLADWDPATDDSFCLYCHGLPLPPVPAPPVVVEVRGAPRENALAKDSQWVRDREGLEALKHPGSNEIVMPAEDGALLEGTQTNFYAVMDGTLQTAGAGVLEGTVRRLVLEVCRDAGIPISLEAPNLRDIGRWEGALISSTSRLALPINEIVLPAPGRLVMADDPRYQLATGGLVARISSLVAAAVAEHSTAVLAEGDGAPIPGGREEL